MTLKVQTVEISQIHEADDLKELRTVTASSVRFTINDYMRRTLLLPV